MSMMAAVGMRAWQAALDLVGAPFRLHGRDKNSGLDCVGLILLAYARAGWRCASPGGYRLTGHEAGVVDTALQQAGFAPVDCCDCSIGDVIVQQGPRGRIHLLLGGAASAVHAHAGLRRVVHGTMPLPADMSGRWRLARPGHRPPTPSGAD